MAPRFAGSRRRLGRFNGVFIALVLRWILSYGAGTFRRSDPSAMKTGGSESVRILVGKLLVSFAQMVGRQQGTRELNEPKTVYP